MKNNIKNFNLHLIALILVLSYSCSKDDPDGINEQEFISNVVVDIASPDGTIQTIDWDLSETNVESINLKPNSNYTVELYFENRSDPTDIEDVTLEIIDEADEHQVFFEFADVSVSVTSAANDTKDGSRGVLLKSVWNASSSGTGIVRVYLIHQPTNFNATTREGFGGFNDVAIDIPVTISD
ncbi:MAG: hypothetical protein CMC63_05345 [Flavobacteriaceae bacterium]|nr:hypothetical protein [Flavobacteriaceae bacterium]